MSENAENLHSLLVRMLGFDFNENQLSPGLRSRLSQLNYEYSRWAHLEELRNESQEDRKREGQRWWLPGLTIFVASLLLGIYIAFFSGMKSVDGSMDVGFLFSARAKPARRTTQDRETKNLRKGGGGLNASSLQRKVPNILQNCRVPTGYHQPYFRYICHEARSQTFSFVAKKNLSLSPSKLLHLLLLKK